jgi:predicted protein tyrosine phosphatase
MNRKNCINNFYQNFDKHKRVLTVCSGGCLRSPTAAFVLGQEPYNFNTRSCGLETEYAIVPIDEGLVHWADEIVFMNQWMRDEVAQEFDIRGKDKQVLDIPDRYAYRDPELIELIKQRYVKKEDELK